MKKLFLTEIKREISKYPRHRFLFIIRTLITVVLFSVFIVIFLGGCSDWGNVSQRAEGSELDSIDYQIISSALNIFLGPHEGGYDANDTSAETREYFGNPNWTSY